MNGVHNNASTSQMIRFHFPKQRKLPAIIGRDGINLMTQDDQFVRNTLNNNPDLDMNQQTTSGYTLTHMVASNDRLTPATLQIAVQRGANLDKANNNGKTARDIIVRNIQEGKNLQNAPGLLDIVLKGKIPSQGLQVRLIQGASTNPKAQKIFIDGFTKKGFDMITSLDNPSVHALSLLSHDSELDSALSRESFMTSLVNKQFNEATDIS